MNSAFAHDRDEVVIAAAKAGVSTLVITGSSERSSIDAAQYARIMGEKLRTAGTIGGLYTTAGIHPHEAKSANDGTLSVLRQLAAPQDDEPVVKAIGECGLDYNRNFSPRDVQCQWFAKQAELAAELSLPLFLHERDAFTDFKAILSEHIKSVPAAVVHCFTGTSAELEHYLSLGCYIGITGWICDERRGKHLQDLVRHIPSDRLMLETDAPYLLPRDLPFKVKSRRNESRFLPHIAETVARCLGKDVQQLARETYANSVRFFNLGSC